MIQFKIVYGLFAKRTQFVLVFTDACVLSSSLLKRRRPRPRRLQIGQVFITLIPGARVTIPTKPTSSRSAFMATEKQLAANRANAQKSAAPKTAAGRLKSSRNAFR